TGGHPGGHAVLGDGKGSNAGSELVSLPNGKNFLSADKPTLYPSLPKGTQVLSAKETKGLFPHYAKGIGSKIKSFASSAWGKVKDVWEYAKNPSKLLNVVMDKIDVIKDKAQIPTQIVKAGFNYLKKKPLEYIKSMFAQADAGGGKPSFGWPITSP